MKSQTIYLRVWRTAFERGKIELSYASAKEARRMRLNLYRAVQPYRKLESSPDPGLTRIIDQMEMVEDFSQDNFRLIIRDKSLNPLVLAAASQLDDLASR